MESSPVQKAQKSADAQAGEGPAAAPFMQLVSFRVATEEYGLDILRVQEIIRVQELTRIPNSPAFVEGVINLRGKVIPVVALRRRFGMEDIPYAKQTRIVVIEVRGVILGLLVDSVSEVLSIPSDTLEAPPRLGRVDGEYVVGVAKLSAGLLILLDADRLMFDAESHPQRTQAAHA